MLFLQPQPSLFLILVVELVRLFRHQAGTRDSSLYRDFLEGARLALHDCRENKKEIVVESVDNQRSLVWALTGLSVGLFVHIVWIVSARCLTASVPFEQDDKFGKNGARKVAPARRGGGLVA